MSALEITIAKLLSVAAVTDMVSNRVFAEVPQLAVKPYILVGLVSEADVVLLEGPAAKFPESTVSVECVALSMTLANAIGEAVKVALQDVTKETIAGHADTDIRKAVSDFADRSDDRLSSRRVLDWYVRWRP